MNGSRTGWRRRFACALAGGFLASTPPAPVSLRAEAPVSGAPSWLNLSLPDEKGALLPLLSLEAYRAEFRHLRKIWHRFDLKGHAVKTDGWNYNVPEAEWPFMGFCYFGYACVNLAQADPAFREEALDEARWLIQALQTPRMSGFVAPHFGEPFGSGEIHPSVFVHGHFLSLAVRYREASGDGRFDPLARRVAEALAAAFELSPHGILKSYRDMYWVSDNLPALSALCRYDRLFGTQWGKVKNRFLANLEARYRESDTGLFATYIDPEKRAILQGPRGISTMYGLHFLRDIDPALAEQQYGSAKRHLLRASFGLAAVREFPEGMEGRADVDSGPVLFGLGPSASGFAIAAAAVMGDRDTADSLLKASVLLGVPSLRGGELEYTIMPSVGQSVILFGKTLLLPVQTQALHAPAGQVR